MKTTEFADGIGIQSTSIHRRVCMTGSYFGVRPSKLPNGRLIWPADAIEQLMAQGAKGVTKEAAHGGAL